MFAPLLSLLPIYILILIGAVALRTGLVDRAALPHISRLAVTICIPVLVASAVLSAGDLSAFNWAFILGYAGAALIVMGLGAVVMARFFGQGRGLSVMMGMGMSSANTIFLGYPVGLVLFPEHVDRLFAWTITAENMVVIPVAMTLADMLSRQRPTSALGAVRQTLGQMIRNPVLIGLAAGLALAGAGVELSAPLEKTRSMIAGAAPLLALFFIGGTMAVIDARGSAAPVLTVAMGKLVAHPMMTFAILALLPGVGTDLAIMAMIFAAMPMFAIFAIMSEKFGGGALASTALVVTTGLGAVTVGALVVAVQGAF